MNSDFKRNFGGAFITIHLEMEKKNQQTYKMKCKIKSQPSPHILPWNTANVYCRVCLDNRENTKPFWEEKIKKTKLTTKKMQGVFRRRN